MNELHKPDPKSTHYVFKDGDRVKVELPYTEVCMHLGVDGQVREIEILSRGVQIYNEDGTKFSFPILHGEAGVYQGSAMIGKPEYKYFIHESHVKKDESNG